MPQMDYFRRPILAGKNVKRLTSGTIRGSIRRNDPDATSANPYFSGVSATQTLIVQTEAGTFTATLTSTLLADAITAINTALGVNGTAFDADGTIAIRTTGIGGSGWIQVTGGTAATALGFDITMGRSLRSSGGDVESAPEARLGNPFGVVFPGIGEDFKAEVFQRGLTRLASNLDVIYMDLVREYAEMQKVTGFTIDVTNGNYITLPAGTRCHNGYVSSGSVLTRNSLAVDLAAFFVVLDSTTKQILPYKVVAVSIGNPAGNPPTLPLTDAANSADTGKNALGLNLSKFGPIAITNIREGRVATCTGAGSTLVAGDIVQIASATNTNRWSNNGMKWVVEQVIDANNLVLRPLSQAGLTQFGITLNDTQPVLELADDLPGGQSYGTLQGFTGAFTTGVSLVISPPLPTGGSYEVWVAQPMSLRTFQAHVEQLSNYPFVQAQSPFKAGSISQTPLAAQRFSAGSTADILQIRNESGTAISRFGASGALVLAPDGTNTTAATATGTGTGAGLSGVGGATSGIGVNGVGGGPNGHGVSGSATGTGVGIKGLATASVGSIGVWGVGAGNNPGVQGDGAGTGAGVIGNGGASGNGGQFTGGATNGKGVTAIGQGTGTGVSATGGNTAGDGVSGTGGTGGRGIVGLGNGAGLGGDFTGGATSGTGVRGVGGGPNGIGLIGTGTGTGVGIQATGGATNAAGGSFTGGATNGIGALGQGTGTGAGFSGIGGATSGSGLSGTGGGPNGVGVVGQGTGAGTGLSGTGGATGSGIVGVGGVSGGTGVQGTGTAGSAGGVFAGQGAGSGVQGTGGATGVGGTFFGGGTSGTGVVGAGVGGNSLGVGGTGSGTGAGVYGTGGLIGAPGVVAQAGFGNTRGALNLVSQTTPTAPSNGDVWFDGTNIGTQLSGANQILATKNYVDVAAVSNFLANPHTWTAAQNFNASVVCNASVAGNTGVQGTGNGSGVGVYGVGGATNGTGGVFLGGGTNGPGINSQGVGFGAGGVFSSSSGPSVYLASNTVRGSLQFTPQAGPSSPIAGDMWFDGTSLFFKRNDGSIKQLAVV